MLILSLVASKDVSVCTCNLRLENKDATQLIAFKVKTTAVKRYVVRPNLGILLPGKSVTVAVLLNYDRARADGVDLATVHDRFQVLSVTVDASASEQLLDLWAKTPEDRIAKAMVKCKFVAPNLVKTVSPVPSAGPDSPAPRGVMLASPEPDLEQAKHIFKQEMANSKAKQEAKALKAERDVLLEQLRDREAALSRALEQLASKEAAGKGVGRLRSIIFFVAIYVFAMMLFFVVVFKTLDYDPFYSISSNYSLTMLERRLKTYLLASLK